MNAVGFLHLLAYVVLYMTFSSKWECIQLTSSSSTASVITLAFATSKSSMARSTTAPARLASRARPDEGTVDGFRLCGLQVFRSGRKLLRIA